MAAERAKEKKDGPLPTRMGRYEIRGKVAEGGMATIYVGRLAGPGGFERLHALKVIKPAFSVDQDFVNMFLDEARIVAKLNHPNVVQIHELGEDTESASKQLFIAMELLLGESLWDIWHIAMSRRRHQLRSPALEGGKKVGSTALPRDVVAFVGARVAEGLHHAHELKDAKGTLQHVVHRDVNPSNILITYDGQVKIIDFGLAKALNRISETGFGVLKGKISYMAPEQARGVKDLDRRADIFALGATLYELTTDQRLFKRADATETLAAVTKADVLAPAKIIDDYEPELWKILEKALKRERDERHSTALEMAQELDAFSRSRGRVVTASTVAELMKELFGDEWERAAKWMEAASSQEPPVEPLHMRRREENEGAELFGQITPEEPKPEPKLKPEQTLASSTKEPEPYTPPPQPGASASAFEERTPAWQYVAVLLVCIVAIFMAIYASRL